MAEPDPVQVQETRLAQQTCWRLLRRHGKELAQAASGVWRALPQARIAGLIVDDDARNAPLRALLSHAHGTTAAGAAYGIVPLADLAAAVRQSAGRSPAALSVRAAVQQNFPIVIAVRDELQAGYLRPQRAPFEAAAAD